MSKVPHPFSRLSVSEWITQLETGNSDERFQALQAIGALATPDEIARSATMALADADPTLRALAAKTLGIHPDCHSEDTETKLLFLLDDSDPDVRFEVSRALIRWKSTHHLRIVPVLLQFLDEPETDPLMVAAVVTALTTADLSSKVVDSFLKSRLLTRLDHDRAEVREAVAVAFAQWPETASGSIDQLIPLLDDSEPVVREKIAFTIGKAATRNEHVIAALQVASKDEDSEVARVANEALQHLTQS